MSDDSRAPDSDLVLRQEATTGISIPNGIQYLVIPTDKMALANVERLLEEIASLRRVTALLTEAVAKVALELDKTNSIEANKLRFSKMKDIMLAKLSRMMEKTRQEVDDGLTAPRKS